MNEALVINILNVIKKSNDKSVIFKALVKLRTDLVKDRDGIVLFRDCGGIAPVVRLLNRPHEKILEVALSILGNCCSDQECCVQALDKKLLSPLITILKSVPNPLVQCRACRLLGNIAKDNKQQFTTHFPAISQSLCLILEESNESQTTFMAVRAAKYLLYEKQFVKTFIKCEGFKILMKILIKIMKNADVPKTINNETAQNKPLGRKSCQPREKYFEEVARHLEGVRSDIFDTQLLKEHKKNKDFVMPEDKGAMALACEILKCFQIISEEQIHIPIVELYANTSGLSCVVFFADEDSPFRSLALRIISNISKNLLAVAALSAADAVTASCDLLTAPKLKTPLSEAEIKCCMNIICLLSGDACNRAKIRRSGALKTLVDKIKSSKSFTEISLILYALNHFQYDQISMDLLLRHGLVGILIKELDAYLNSNDKYRKEKCEEKKRTSRKRKLENTSEACYKNPKMWADLFEPDSPVGSPKNYMSPSSPCSSRSLSPNYRLDNECEDETYSPVCSGDEGDSSDEGKSKEEDNDVMKLLVVASKVETNIDENMSDKEDDDEINQECVNSKAPFSANLPSSAIDIIDNLLLRVSLLIANRGELGKPETLQTILQAISQFGLQGNSFGTTLTNILSESQFFVNVLKQDVISRLYLLSKIEELQLSGIFETLTSVAESGYGRGELTRLLMKGEHSVQKKAAIGVAFTVRNPKFLYYLLTECGALNILLYTILSNKDDSQLEAADAITSLSQALGITLPNSDCSLFNSEQEFDESMDFPFSNGEQSDENMKFILHRGCSKIPIHFNKKLLTENSEVFNSMLNSDFRECNEGEIHLKEYTVNGIKYFLNLVNLLSKNHTPNIPPVYHFDSILEAYELSRMYIMENLEKQLFNMIVHRLNYNTCLRVFEWSLRNFNQELSEIAINYYLCSDLENKLKVKMFREADFSSHSSEWNQMMTDAILVKCQNLSVDFRESI